MHINKDNQRYYEIEHAGHRSKPGCRVRPYSTSGTLVHLFVQHTCQNIPRKYGSLQESLAAPIAAPLETPLATPPFLNMVAKAFTKIKPYFPYFLMNSAMQYMNLTFSDITESKFCTKNFKMAAIFKMASKI